MKMFKFISLKFILFLSFSSSFIQTAERIEFEYNVPSETDGATVKWAENWKLARNPMIVEPLTPEQIVARKEFEEKENNYKAPEQRLKEERDQKIIELTKKNQTIKIQRATREYLQSKRVQQFEDKIKQLADTSYPTFKTLICTGDYIDKTDWIYQFIEAMENKVIFERDENGKIISDKFTKKFTDQVQDPQDWVEEKILKYINDFYASVYQVFESKAVEQMIKYKTSWTDAVSTPTPKDHFSFKGEDEPLYPIVYRCNSCTNIHFVLGEIFIDRLHKDHDSANKLDFYPILKDEEEYGFIDEDRPDHKNKNFSFNFLNQQRFIYVTYDPKDPSSFDNELKKEFQDALYFPVQLYLENLGKELSPEEEISDCEEEFSDCEYEQKTFRHNNQINWASSARQTFLLGQLLFDNNLEALDELGGKEWLDKQPQDIQNIITKHVEKIKNAPAKQKFKRKTINHKPVTKKQIKSDNMNTHLTPEREALKQVKKYEKERIMNASKM